MRKINLKPYLTKQNGLFALILGLLGWNTNGEIQKYNAPLPPQDIRVEMPQDTFRLGESLEKTALPLRIMALKMIKHPGKKQYEDRFTEFLWFYTNRIPPKATIENILRSGGVPIGPDLVIDRMYLIK